MIALSTLVNTFAEELFRRYDEHLLPGHKNALRAMGRCLKRSRSSCSITTGFWVSSLPMTARLKDAYSSSMVTEPESASRHFRIS